MPAKKRSAKSASNGRKSKKAKTVSNHFKTPVTQPGQDGSWGFFKLPRELRDEIYRRLAVFTTRQVLVPCKNPFVGCPKGRNPEPAISRSCRRAREEVLPIYYGQNRFAVLASDFSFDALDRFVTDSNRIYLVLIKDLWLVLSGVQGLPTAVGWMTHLDTTFWNTKSIEYHGNSYMAESLKKACEIGSDLRDHGMEWPDVRRLLKKCGEMAEVSSPMGGDWSAFGDFDEEGEFDEACQVHVEFCGEVCGCGEHHCIEDGELDPSGGPAYAYD